MIAVYNTPYKVLDTRKYNTWCKYRTRIDTYGLGCQHGCSYCYARALLGFRGLWQGVPAVSYITEIERAISKIPRNEVVRLGAMTDCFQPIEHKYNVTYETIKLLNQYRINYVIVTKGVLVCDQKYLEIYDHDLAHFQISISCTDSNMLKKIEGGLSCDERIRCIEQLSSIGFDVSLRLNPFVFTHTDIGIINKIKCKKVLIEFLKVNHWIKKNLDIDYSEYTCKYGGHENLELERKIKLANLIDGLEQRSVGEYVSEHYEYFSQNFNYNKNDCCNLSLNIQPEDSIQEVMAL